MEVTREPRVVVVTGAARGIGLAVGRRLAAGGDRVVMGDVDTGTLATAAPSAGAEWWGELDVTDRGSFEGFLGRAEAEVGPVDVLVNNAGIMPTGSLVDQDDDVLRRAWEVNLGGVVTGTRLALDRMLPRGRGHVVNMASMLGELACPGVAVYCGTKFAVAGFTDAVRREVAARGVDVTAVLPAFVDSDLTTGLPAVRGFRSLRPEQVAEAVAGVLDRPRGRVYVPRSAAAVLQLQRLLPAPAVDRVLRPFGLDRMFLGPRPGR